jgi:iron complex outermembrane receptor protein
LQQVGILGVGVGMSMERVSIRAALLVAVSGGMIAGMALPGWALDLAQDSSHIPRIGDRDRPATTVKQWRAQIDAATTQVTGITLNRRDDELEIVL